jgi:type IV secretory pathway VirB4 component
VGLNALAHFRNMTATALAHMFPFSSRQYLMPGGLFYGLSRLDRSLVVLDDFELMNANTIVVGKQGSGKSVFLKQKIEQAILQGMRCYVVDIEGEYRALCEDLGGVYLNLAASRETIINVLDVDPHDVEEQDGLLINSYASFAGWLRVAVGNLSAREQNLASDAYLETMERAGIKRDEPRTWRRPAPLVSDFYATLETMPDAHAQDLAARLRAYAVGIYAPIFNAPTNIEVNNPLVVFGLEGIPDTLLTIRLWQVISFVWTHVLQKNHPTYFIIDEAWHLLQQGDVAADLAAMARRFRKKYGGLILATQHATDLANNPHAVAIRDTAATVVLFAQGDPAIPLLRQLFQLNAAQSADLVRLAPGQALLFTHQHCIPLQVLIPPDRWELFTTKAKELAALRAAGLQ